MPPAQPNTPNPNYDFILSGNQPAKSKFGLNLPKLPKPLSTVVVVILVLFLLIIIYVVAFGSKSTTSTPLVSAITRAQEINRVSALVTQAAQDDDTKSLAATVSSVLTSEQTQLTHFTGKLSTSALAANQNKTTDTQIQNTPPNNLNQFYKGYLKINLALYETSLSTAYKSAKISAKPVLTDAFASTDTIIKSL